jgi:hypothetical protein
MQSLMPRSLVQPFRKNTVMIGAGWRAYFAPFDAASAATTIDKSVGPRILDLSQGPFDRARVTPAGFFDLGWTRDFAVTTDTRIGQLRAGYRGAVSLQFRGQIGETFEFKFREYGRLQYKIATGANIMNLIPGTVPSTLGPLSATGGASTGLTAYTAVDNSAGIGGQPTVTVASVAGFSAGQFIVADIDYNPATYGMVGDAMTPVFPNAVTDIDFIRKNSDYVARVVGISGTKLILDQQFAGGGGFGNVTPQAGSKVQRIVGFAARNGGTYISEWTGLFLMDTVDQCQFAVYYPHVSILTPRNIANAYAIENIGTTDLTGYELDAQYAALAFDDPEDGETVVGYRAMYLRPNGVPGY